MIGIASSGRASRRSPSAAATLSAETAAARWPSSSVQPAIFDASHRTTGASTRRRLSPRLELSPIRCGTGAHRPALISPSSQYRGQIYLIDLLDPKINLSPFNPNDGAGHFASGQRDQAELFRSASSLASQQRLNRSLPRQARFATAASPRGRFPPPRDRRRPPNANRWRPSADSRR